MSTARLAACLLLPAMALAAPDRSTVAVLYFDNNTGNREMDVLQKGLADMLVTDLSAVERLEVVEREKLQALIGELELQRGKYFDPSTAQKVGKLAGARYAVTGAFAAIDPKLRIDVRLIEVATGKVVVADQVVGEKGKLFDLHQQLVGKFVAGLNLKLGASRPKTRVNDVDTLLAYSRGIDLIDQGKLDDASAALAEVIRKAPAFGLARERRDQLVLRLKEAKDRRKEALSDAGATLLGNAERFLTERRLEELSEQDARTYLGYRLIKGQFTLRALRKHLSAKHPHPVRLGQEAQALALMRAYVENQRTLAEEYAFFVGKHGTVVNGVRYPPTGPTLPPDDDRRADEAKLGDVRAPHPSELPAFILLGRANDGESFFVSPPLARFDPKAEKEAYAMLERALAEAKAQGPAGEYVAVQLLDDHAEALLLAGRTEEAIAKWQEILDTWASGRQFERFERRIKEELGLEGTNAAKLDGLEYPAKLEACDEWGIRKGIDNALYARLRTHGLEGIKRVMQEFERRCGKDELTVRRGVAHYVYKSGALTAAAHDDCEAYRFYMQKYLDAGGSKGDLDGYNRNWAPHCQRK